MRIGLDKLADGFACFPRAWVQVERSLHATHAQVPHTPTPSAFPPPAHPLSTIKLLWWWACRVRGREHEQQRLVTG